MINKDKIEKNSKSGIRSLGLGICSGILAIGVFFNSVGISEAALVNEKDKSKIVKLNTIPRENLMERELMKKPYERAIIRSDKAKNISSVRITGPEYVVATFNKSDFNDKSKKEDDKDLKNFLKYDITTGNITIDLEKQYDKIRITKDGEQVTEITQPEKIIDGLFKDNSKKWVITPNYYKDIKKIKVEILKSLSRGFEQKIGTQEIDILKEKEKAELEKEKPKENQPKVEMPNKELPKKEDKEETEEQIRRRKERERREDETARDRRNNQNQKYKKGWNKVSEKWYYTNDGVKFVRSSWIYDEGNSSWYYLNEYGEMTSNKWVQYSDGSWYYLLENGKMAVSKWVKHTDNNWYYLLGNGKMAVSEWVKHTNSWYYLLENGKMAKSEWVYDKKYVSWYYFNNGGDMAVSKWVRHTNNNWYYLLSDGKMAKSTIIDGWYVDANGIWKNR